jgi:hypothetical protein
MRLLRWWPTLRTTFIAVTLFVIAVGIAQFAVTEWSEPCLRIRSPYQRLSEWLRDGGREPLSQVLGPRELKRLASLSLSMSVLWLMLVISIRAQRPLRLHLHTLMVLVAILPFGYLGGRQVWLMWERWDEYEHRIQRCWNTEEWAQRKNPSDTPEVAAVKRQAALDCGLERERLQRAVWSPKFLLALVSQRPLP